MVSIHNTHARSAPKDFWSQPKTQVLTELHSNEHHGLTNQEARHRLTTHSYNELKKADRPSPFNLLLRQLNSPFVYILLAASAISLYERQWTELGVILAVIVVNSVIGFFEEYRAEQTISKLRSILAPQARVIRESVEQKISARYLVPGDIIIVEAGDRVPADARLIEARSLRVNQAPLTGESLPAHKRETIIGSASALLDRDNMIYLATLVVTGRGVAVVNSTGMGTELGSIAREVSGVKEAPSDLQKKLQTLGSALLLSAIVLSIISFVIGFSNGVPVLEMFRTTLALLVSVVPEGLPIALTVTLSVGLTRLFRRHSLIRQLSATETLGSITTLCVDKTGTLTEGAMMVEKIVLPSGEYSVTGRGFDLTGSFFEAGDKIAETKVPQLDLILKLASLATMSSISKDDLLKNRAKQLTDPTETALAVVAAKAGYYAFEEERDYPELLEIPFDQELRYSASIHKFDSRHRVIVKGSPESLIALCDYVAGSKKRRLLPADRDNLTRQADALATEGYRLVALAYADYAEASAINTKLVKHLTWVGLLALADPIRPEAKNAISSALDAGVRTIMITGDHLLTAKHIARKLGFDTQGEIIHAQEIAGHDLSKVSVIARATPKDKLLIIERLQRHGQLVAMTGDGVNDAPALKKADIGVAMGRGGSDIAVEASHMVLLNDNITGIISAIAEGRLIWENIKKIVYYLVSTSLGEIMVIIGAVMLGWPLPVLAVQILWMNLVTDGVTSMALAVEPAEEDLMKRPPRNPTEPILSKSAIARMMLVSVVMALGALFVYGQFSSDPVYARSATLTTLVFFQLFNLFNSRSATVSVFAMNWWQNRWLLLMFGVAMTLQLGALYWSPIATVLGLTALDWPTLALCLTVSLSIILVDELRKWTRVVVLSWAKVQEAFN